MDCNSARILIQQSFDFDLPDHDYDELERHKNGCGACEGLYNQIRQVINAAQEGDLPEDIVPPNLESLARSIIEHTPQKKSGFMAAFSGIFGIFSKKPKVKEPTGKFPHVRRSSSDPDSRMLDPEDPRSTTNRLRTMSRSQQISTEPTGKTLGSKFGIGGRNEPSAEAPMNLAQSIKRKVTEERQTKDVFNESEPPSPEFAPDDNSLLGPWAGSPPEGSWSMPAAPPPDPVANPPSGMLDVDWQNSTNSGITSGAAMPPPPPPPSMDASAPPQLPPQQPSSDWDPWSQDQNSSGNLAPGAGSSWTEPEDHPVQPNLPQEQYSQEQDFDDPNKNIGPGRSWNQEAEQIETGFWHSYSPAEESLGAPTPLPQANNSFAVPQNASPPAPPPASAQNQAPAAQAGSDATAQDPGSFYERLTSIIGDIPGLSDQSNSNEQSTQAPNSIPSFSNESDAVKASDLSRFDMPIQERMRQSSASNPQTPTIPAPPTPPQTAPEPVGGPSAVASAPPTGTPAAPPVDPYELSIQERMQLQAQQQAAAIAQAPAATPQVTQSTAPPPPPAPAKEEGGLFNIDDDTLDSLFSQNLGVNEDVIRAGVNKQPSTEPLPPQQNIEPPPAPVQPAPPMPEQQVPQPVTPPPMQQTPPTVQQQAMTQPQPPAATAPVKDGLFSVDDDDIDSIFSEQLGVKEQPTVPPQAIPASPPPIQQATPPPIQQPASPPPIQQAAPPPIQQPASPPPIQQAAPSPVQQPASPPPIQQAAPSPVQQPASPPPIQQAAPPAKPSDGLFSVDDDDIDNIFSEQLGIKEEPKVTPSTSFAPEPPVQEVAVPPQATQEPMAIQEQGGEPPQSQPPPPPTEEPVKQTKAPTAGSSVKIEGLGRLDKSMDTQEDAPTGKISSIGKFILDQEDLSNLSKLAQSDLSDSRISVLTSEASQELKGLLQEVKNQPGALGSVIVGHDGLLIAEDLPEELDSESIGVWALGMYLNTDNVVKKMGHERTRQLITKTPMGYLVIADFGGGIIVSLSEGQATDKLIPLLRSIASLITPG